MFRLIKLAMYAMVGYVLYELYQGMTHHQGQFAGGGGRGGRSFDDQSGNFGGLTGPGEGATDTASDMSGSEMRHRVGRGVIRSGAPI